MINILSSVSTMAAVLLNIKLGISNASYMEQGNTLSHTLLPYINKLRDFSFIPNDLDSVMNSFLVSLI